MIIDSMAWLNEEEMREYEVKHPLIVKPSVGDAFGFGVPEAIQLSITSERYPRLIGFPRELPQFAELSMTRGSHVSFCRAPSLPKDTLDLKSILNEEQFLLVDFYRKQFQRRLASNFYAGGIICAPPGSGKTFMGLATTQGYKTIVIVHKQFLMEQWEKEALKFGYKQEDIGFIVRDTYEIGNSLTIASAQSLLAREGKYPKSMRSEFGAVLIDEAHRFGAEQFHKVIPMFDAAIRVGLTATPYRKDGLADVFTWHIGPILHTATKSSRTMQPTIYFERSGVAIDDTSFIGYNGKINLAKMLTCISESPTRTERILKLVTKAATSGRNILLLTDRVKHAKEMAESLTTSDIPAVLFTGKNVVSREGLLAAKVICATYQIAKEALDVPTLDTLVLATPKADVVQTTGRILRFYAGKKPPMVIDLVDQGALCRAFARKRCKEYKLTFGAASVKGEENVRG